MNIAGIDYESINNGYGTRAVIYVSGCSHKCIGCHNPETHDVNYGVTCTKTLQDEIIHNIRQRPFICGITFSGGDPLHSNNVVDVLNFITIIKTQLPNKDIWLYTGYTWDQIFYPVITDNFDIERDQIIDCRKKIVKMCDIIVDGPYIESQRDITLPFRGSTNQRIIDVKQSLAQNQIIQYKIN